MTEAQTAAEIAHFEAVETYIRDLLSKPSSLSDDEKTLIAGNLRGFYSTIHPFELDEHDRALIDAAWEQHRAAKPTSAKTFDSKCYDLASAFLEDEPNLFTDANCNELAAEIQRTIEDFIADAKRNSEPQDASGFEGGFAANH